MIFGLPDVGTLPNDTDDPAAVVNDLFEPGAVRYPDTVSATNANICNPASVNPAAPFAILITPDTGEPAALRAVWWPGRQLRLLSVLRRLLALLRLPAGLQLRQAERVVLAVQAGAGAGRGQGSSHKGRRCDSRSK